MAWSCVTHLSCRDLCRGVLGMGPVRLAWDSVRINAFHVQVTEGAAN